MPPVIKKSPPIGIQQGRANILTIGMSAFYELNLYYFGY